MTVRRAAALFVGLLFLLSAIPAGANEIQRWGWQYLGWGKEFHKVEKIRTFTYGYDQSLTLERVVEGGGLPVGMSRLQFRDQYGRIVAYTPTRITAVPFCFFRQMCWVFLWKTVYPLPAIYKFNVNQDKWSRNPDAPMVYTRRGGGEGFTEQFNPVFGVFGLILLFFDRIFYVCICVLMALALSLQVVKYHDMPEFRKLWVKRIVMMLSGLLPGPFLLDPMKITALLIAIWGIVGMAYYGITFVNTVGIVFATFTLCTIRLARRKAADKNG